ncbi:hypothetical protein EVAR_44479_1 [Eumeta japonica]|uniref:Uncharacterized protein n=1 Tax=Eumeta variegata TaxID=151549 RepID=A0A4C1WN08_EUMVA|nr:hypothetical protein EVAR_44479_1 [Eumeta japonica]
MVYVSSNVHPLASARGRPIIVEWERDGHSAGLSRSVTHRYVTERYTFHNLLFVSKISQLEPPSTRIQSDLGTADYLDTGAAMTSGKA